MLAGRSASPASAATSAERASRAAALRDTVARMDVNPRCSPLSGIRAGSRWGKREPALPFALCSSPSPPHSWRRARAAPAVRRAQLPAWLQGAACAQAPGRAHHTLLCGCSLTRATAKMELSLYEKLMKRRT